MILSEKREKIKNNMKIDLHKIPIREVIVGYKDSAEAPETLSCLMATMDEYIKLTGG